MIVTVTQFRNLAVDKLGQIMPIGGERLVSEKRTTVGAFAALNADARIVRVASDTAIEVVIGGKSDYLPANQPEYFSVNGLETVTVAAVT